MAPDDKVISESVSGTGKAIKRGSNKFSSTGTTSSGTKTVGVVAVFSFITIVIVAGAIAIYWNYTEGDRLEVFQVAWDWGNRTIAQLQEDTSKIAKQIIDNLQKQLDSLAANFGSVVINPLKNFLVQNADNDREEIQRRLQELINRIISQSNASVLPIHNYRATHR